MSSDLSTPPNSPAGLLYDELSNEITEGSQLEGQQLQLGDQERQFISVNPGDAEDEKKRLARNAKARARRAEEKALKLRCMPQGNGRKRDASVGAPCDDDGFSDSGAQPAQKKTRVEKCATVYIHIEPPPLPASRGPKSMKTAQQKPIQKGPFFHNVMDDFATFKFKLAKALPCKIELMPFTQMEWRYEKPASDKKKPMSAELGYEAMVTSLKERKKDLVVYVSMPPPAKDNTVSLTSILSIDPVSDTFIRPGTLGMVITLKTRSISMRNPPSNLLKICRQKHK